MDPFNVTEISGTAAHIACSSSETSCVGKLLVWVLLYSGQWWSALRSY